MTHDEAITAICGVLSVTLLSYQEAIEGYLHLRGVTDYEGLAPAQGGVTRMGGDGEAGSGAEGTSTRSRSDAPEISRNPSDTGAIHE